jgi:hypothetical protein
MGITHRVKLRVRVDDLVGYPGALLIPSIRYLSAPKDHVTEIAISFGCEDIAREGAT